VDKTKKVSILVIIFILFGLVVIFFTHQATPQTKNLVAQENYAAYIKPWIDSVYTDQSLDNISNIKNNFLNFQGADKSIGDAHIALFLAFDAWERFLLTGDIDSRDQAIKHFSVATGFLPELSADINNLENILKQQNV